MSALNDFPLADLPESDETDFKPWEQRPAPGMGAGGGHTLALPEDEPPQPARHCLELFSPDLQELVDRQTDLAYYPMIERHTVAESDSQEARGSNREIWQLFLEEELYDTRRVKLEHFHLFEWFPLTPGRFHTAEAQEMRHRAYDAMFQTEDGRSYFTPHGKASMLRGGIGAVRFHPRMVADEPHYFMSASSNGVCHEGFPVLIPRRFYGPLKRRLLKEGAVPVNLGGEMRYLQMDNPTFLGGNREIPQLYLHVDQVEVLPQPRSEVKGYTVSAAISFIGEFEQREGIYTTYATFNPASRESLDQAVNWMGKFYVSERYQGVVITDFDEMHRRFPEVIFGLPDLMAGRLDQNKINAFLKKQGFGEKESHPYFVVYKEINTQGGAYIAGDVNTGGGDFVGRDKVIRSE